ncbi:MAG: nitroreductase family protein [Dysgonamonadaceae bacterium]|jgi:nitroreductase|nr:nitroreductase family protein [Dysgonamonadaceae bacterium]
MKKAKTIIKLLWCFFSDFCFYVKNSLVISSGRKEKKEAVIMLTMHALEKGLSFSQKKEDWGKEKSKSLVFMVNNYLKKYGQCETTVVAINILKAYLEDSFSTKDLQVRQQIEELLEKNRDSINKVYGGAKEVEMPQLHTSFDDILYFYQKRCSVRKFSETPISQGEIENALKVAITTPSACNRQSSRLHVYSEKEIINRLIQNQLGDQGWCNNTQVLFVITSHQSYFGDTYERYQALIDGGMFAMNFLMGLHAQNIASCFKMFVREPVREKEFKKIGNIDSAEIPVVLILAGHYSKTKEFSPVSHRLNQSFYFKEK